MSRRWSIAEARSNLPGLVRAVEAGRAVELLYGGDRMWPALRHGQRWLYRSSRHQSGAR